MTTVTLRILDTQNLETCGYFELIGLQSDCVLPVTGREGKRVGIKKDGKKYTVIDGQRLKLTDENTGGMQKTGGQLWRRKLV